MSAASPSVAARGHRADARTRHAPAAPAGRLPFTSCVNSADPDDSGRERAAAPEQARNVPLGTTACALGSAECSICSVDVNYQNDSASGLGRVSQVVVIASLRVCPRMPRAYITYLYKTRMYTFTDAGLGNLLHSCTLWPRRSARERQRVLQESRGEVPGTRSAGVNMYGGGGPFVLGRGSHYRGR